MYGGIQIQPIRRTRWARSRSPNYYRSAVYRRGSMELDAVIIEYNIDMPQERLSFYIAIAAVAQ